MSAFDPKADIGKPPRSVFIRSHYYRIRAE
jgi:hypothetical protein